MISYKKALSILIKNKIKTENEMINSKNSSNRICAKNIYSPTDYPSGNNTAFDGFAVSSKETNILNKIKQKKSKKIQNNKNNCCW